MIGQFFAVTFSTRSVSLYRVNADPDRPPQAEKIDLVGEGSTPVGYVHGNNKPMLAIGIQLIWYDPGEARRDLNGVERKGWGANTSWVAGLFLTEDEARKCFAAAEHHICDERFIENTWEVVNAIGQDHPTICVPSSMEFGLIEHASPII